MSTKSPNVSVRAVTETASTHLQRIESIDHLVQQSRELTLKLDSGYLFSRDLPEFYLFPFPERVGNDEEKQERSLKDLEKLVRKIADEGITWEDLARILQETEAQTLRQPIPFSLSCYKLSMVTRFFGGRPVGTHAHDDDQFRLVMNGRVRVTVYDRQTVNDTTYTQLDTYTLAAGDWFWIQAGTPYSLAVVATPANTAVEEDEDTAAPAQSGKKRMLYVTSAGASSADLFAMYMVRCCPPPPKPCRMVEIKVE